MSSGPRDGAAARAAVVGLLASIGAIAALAWFPARYLADWAVHPIDLWVPDPAAADALPAFEDFEMSKWDFRNALAGTAVTMGWLAAAYWLLAYLLGAARLASPPRWRASDPSVLLGGAIVAGMAIGFIGAAGRFVVGPLVDACARQYHAARPEQAFSSLGIHRCESRVGAALLVAFLLLVVGLMGASLWRRYRLRAAAAAQ